MKICIDPGHGMSSRTKDRYDPGAVATNARGETFAEADAALRYAHTLRKILEARDVDVYLTRSSSAQAAPLRERARRAEEACCTHLVSLHLNASANEDANGLEVLYRLDKKDKPLACRLQDALVDVTGLRDRGAKKRTDLAILRFTPGPAVLIELGFITSVVDRGYLYNGEHRRAVCKAIADVLIEK